MAKIRLKNWQHIIILSLLALMLVVVLIDNNPGKESQMPKGDNIYATGEIKFSNVDTISRLFYEGSLVGDSVQYQEIEGSTDGFMISVFLTGRECDYVLKIDSRDSKFVPVVGDTLIISSRNFENVVLLPHFTLSLESKVLLNVSNSFIDVLEFDDYYVRLICTRKNKDIGISGDVLASAFLKNPKFFDDKILLSAKFNADSIAIGSRIVN